MRSIPELWRLAPVFVAVLVTSLIPGRARAQAVDEATRHELLAQAQHEADAGHHAQALEIAQRAGRIRMSPSLYAFFSQEFSELHRPASALNAALQCIRAFEADAQLPNREQALATCRQIRGQVQSQVAHLTVHVPSPIPAGLRVVVGDTEVNSALYETAIVVDPGTVAVTARADGMTDFRQEVTVASGATAEVRLAMTPSQNDRHTPAAETHGVSIRSSSRPGPETSGPSLALPGVVIGIGVVGLVLGAVFSVLRMDAISRVNATCDPPAYTRCVDSPDLQSRIAAVNTWNMGADVGWVAGGVLTGIGVVWLAVSALSHHAPPPEHARWRVVPVLGSAGGGFLLEGSL